MDQYELRLLRTDALAREFRLRVIEISDCNMQNLIPYFPEANACINAAREEGGKILVCCIGGLSRSPSFVIAYTMEMFNLRASQAYQYVQSKRLCITPNEGFKSQLNVSGSEKLSCVMQMGLTYNHSIGVRAYLYGSKECAINTNLFGTASTAAQATEVGNGR